MGMSLAEALEQVALQPGRTYRETVRGRTIEVRVLDEGPATEVAEQVMLQPFVEFPFTPRVTIRPTRGTLPLPDPPEIPPDEES